MVLKRIFISDKPVVEKSRMIIYRLRKKIYIIKTRIYQGSKCIGYNKLSQNSFFITDLHIQTYGDKYKEDIIAEANRLLENSYRDISGNILSVGKYIDWNKDYIFNYRWDLKHYSKYTLKSKEILTDVKHVWELSRFYHLVILAQAYKISKDEIYVKKIVSDVLSWEEQNPFNRSVNWTVSMEVAIRVVNLIQATSLIKESSILDKKVNQNINNLIYRSGEYIWNNLEKGLNANNHYLSNLVGLIWVGIYFKSATDIKLKNKSNKYLKLSLNQLSYELAYQINNDGFSYEDSVSYHGLNTEMLLLTVKILDDNNIIYPDIIKDKVINMLVALKNLMIGDKIPLFGDIDNGRLIIYDIIANRDKTNFGYLIKTADEIGFLKKKNFQRSSPILYNDSGFYRIYNSVFDTIIKCGKIGLNGIGGHAHNDQLSLVLNIFGEQILVDSGTGYYSGDYGLRRLLRSTDSHNTFSINNHEQNNIDIDLFKMIEQTHSELIYVDSNSFEGKHFGFFNSLGIEYTRKIEINKENIRIIDRISKIPNEECYISFIFDRDVRIKRIDNVSLYIQKKNIQVKFEVEFGFITILDHLISNSYGDVKVTKKVKVVMQGHQVETIIMLLREGEKI